MRIQLGARFVSFNADDNVGYNRMTNTGVSVLRYVEDILWLTGDQKQTRLKRRHLRTRKLQHLKLSEQLIDCLARSADGGISG